MYKFSVTFCTLFSQPGNQVTKKKETANHQPINLLANTELRLFRNYSWECDSKYFIFVESLLLSSSSSYVVKYRSDIFLVRSVQNAEGWVEVAKVMQCKPLSNGTWQKGKLVFSGKRLQPRQSGPPRIKTSGIWPKWNLHATGGKISVHWGSVIARLHCIGVEFKLRNAL